MKSYRVFPEARALELAEKLSGLEWPEGKARTKELTGTVKQNGEILSHTLLQAIGKRIVNHPEIQLDCIPYKMHPPKFSRYADGQHYKLHTDAAWMGETRTDLSCTLWLSDGYGGGELVIDGEPVKGRPGECVIYDCGAPHEVKPVTSGERICAVGWIQSRIRDPMKRQLVSDFRKGLAPIEDTETFLALGRVHSALLRMWIEP